MADKWIPDDILAFSPKLRNITENPTTVQFDHRVLGTTTLCLISGLWLMSRRRQLPPRAYRAATAVGVMAWIQVCSLDTLLRKMRNVYTLLLLLFQVLLGITTLLTYVPIPLAASHQSGSLVLLSTAVWLTHELKRLPKWSNVFIYLWRTSCDSLIVNRIINVSFYTNYLLSLLYLTFTIPSMSCHCPLIEILILIRAFKTRFYQMWKRNIDQFNWNVVYMSKYAEFNRVFFKMADKFDIKMWKILNS